MKCKNCITLGKELEKAREEIRMLQSAATSERDFTKVLLQPPARERPYPILPMMGPKPSKPRVEGEKPCEGLKNGMRCSPCVDAARLCPFEDEGMPCHSPRCVYDGTVHETCRAPEAEPRGEGEKP